MPRTKEGGPRGREPQGARAVAARVLERVSRDGAYAAAALDAEIERLGDLDPRDRALATEIVYGVLRTRGALVARLARQASRGLPKDETVVLHLLIAAYQVLLLERVPAHAAVDAAVSAVSAVRGARVGGFANALLRKLSGEKLDREQAILESTQPWLLASLTAAVGTDAARALLGVPGPHTEAGEEHTAVRLGFGRDVPEWLAGAAHGRVSPVARLVPRAGDLRRRPGYADGTFVIQEEGAQAVALAVGARRGERVLDACSGRGQKTAMLRERIGPDAELWAVDMYPKKLSALEGEFAKLGLVAPKVAAVDWTVGTGPVPDTFDRVLVDAPCTGTGTLRHRPEIALRLKPDDPKRLGELAEKILRGASSRAKPGGRVVFAVCSVLTEECEAVVGRVADVLDAVPFDAPELSHWLPETATTVRLLPGRDDTDGFFIASFRKRP